MRFIKLILKPILFVIALIYTWSIYGQVHHFLTQAELDSIYLKSIEDGIDSSYERLYYVEEGVFDIKINEFLAINSNVLADSYGEFDDWIELYNFGDDPINLNGLIITDDKDAEEKFIFTHDIYIQPDSFIILWADKQTWQGYDHLNFNLDSDGDQIYLFASDGITLIDSVSYNTQLSDISYGRLKSNMSNWDYFLNPTPGTSNPETGIETIAPDPTSNRQSGFYSGSFSLIISNSLPGSSVYYTLDYSEPTTSSPVYSSPLLISATTVVRFKVYKVGYLPSRTITQTFLFGTDNKLDVLSLVTDSDNLFGPTGIFLHPTNGLEKPIHMEYFRRDQEFEFSMDAGVKMHAPKAYPQKSLNINARSMYGKKYMGYQFFEYKNIHEFRSIILRNAANDGTQTSLTQRTNYRDALMHLVYRSINPKRELMSAYRPVSVYLNGVYWGIYNLRERIDKDYIEENLGYTGNMDLLEFALNEPGTKIANEGDFVLYDSINNFIKDNDLSIQANYNFVSNYIDINNFTDYWIYEVFIGNFDWLINNIKIYRPRIPGGKFKWILWDVDHGFGLPYQSYGDPSWNTLAWSTSTENGRPSNGASTVFIRGLLQNEIYKNYFINRFADLLNENLNSEFIEPVIDSIYYLLYPEIQKQLTRWNGMTFANWEASIQTVRKYVAVRPGYVRNHIMSKFELTDTFQLTIGEVPKDYGKVRVNTIIPDISEEAWKGIYFSGVPVELEAIPEPGYKFVQWIGVSDTTKIINLNLTGNKVIEAVFEPILIDINRLVINEICFKSKDNYEAEDWLEIMNASGLTVDLSSWKIEDSIGHEFIIPPGTILKNYNYLVIAKDLVVFKSLHENSIASMGNLPFLLSEKNHHLFLYNDSNKLIDEVNFDVTYSCAQLANGKGFTFELKNPYLENNIMTNWKSSTIPDGTPGKQNTPASKSMLGLYINELMADNVNTVADEYGEYNDWFELYNSTNEKISIKGLFITDDDDDWKKYHVPFDDDEDLTIGPKEFKLVWLDKDTTQGPLHTNFKINNLSDDLYLFQNSGCEVTNLDAISFGQQIPDVSFGRYTDGVYNWLFLKPTPGEPNQILTAINEVEYASTDQKSRFLVYPNPSYGMFTIIDRQDAKKSYNIIITNALGQLIFSKSEINNQKELFSLDNVKTGMYFIRMISTDGSIVETLKLQIIK